MGFSEELFPAGRMTNSTPVVTPLGAGPADARDKPDASLYRDRWLAGP